MVNFGIFSDPKVDHVFDNNVCECIEIVSHPERHKRISVATAVTVVRTRYPSFEFSDLALRRERENALVAARASKRYFRRGGK